MMSPRGTPRPPAHPAVVRFVAGVIRESGADSGIDGHCRRDRGLAVMSSIAALDAGATRLHGTALGSSERVGNTATDCLLVNLALMQEIERDLNR